MIPKKVHFCWLSGEKMPAEMERCRESWKLLAGWDFVLWDRRKAAEIGGAGQRWIEHWLERKNYAFAADYIRLWALWSEGGVYLDTDVEVLKPFDDLLARELLLGAEGGTGDVEAAVIGAEAGNRKILRVLESFDSERENAESEIGQETCGETLPKRMKRVLSEETLLPSDYLSPKDWKSGRIALTGNTYCIHHFAGSWLSRKEHAAQWAERHFGAWTVPCVRWIMSRTGSRE